MTKAKKLLLILTIFTIIPTQGYCVARSKAVQNASYSDGISKAMKSVVSLTAIKSTVNIKDNIDLLTSKDMKDGKVKMRQEESLGSGVIVSSDGTIVTNSHTVDHASLIKVTTYDNNSYSATLVAIDKSLDLAVLKINANGKKDFNKATFSDSGSLRVGDLVFALGNPFGIGQSASMGIISALGRINLSIENAQYLIQTDAAVNPGNSGGALIDVDGNIVGINSAIFSKTSSFSGVSFAVPSNAVKFVIDSLTKGGHIKKSWFGVKGENISNDLQKRLRVSSKNGVYVTQIAVGSPADLAGIKVGDVLVKVHTYPIPNTSYLTAISPTLPVNRKISVRVLRDSRSLELEVKLKAINARDDSDKYLIRENNLFKGFVVEKLSQELNYMLGLPLSTKGLAVVERPPMVTDLNVQAGDVIVSINGKKLNSIDSMKKALSSKGYSGWKVNILRKGRNLNIFVQ